VVKKFADSGLSAEKAARKILKGVVGGKARILVAGHTYIIDWLQRLFPAGYRRMMMPLLGIEETNDLKQEATS
jgi:hypothetical protein